ncbi:MAG TPA: hypothetical protein VMA75_03380 [Candidatus Paceibacterota bacterium]|nr:hypothetical protein [Candidatus Paceibacterota bacterium]
MRIGIDFDEVVADSGATIMIEDHMTNATVCAEAGIKVFLFDQPWNQGELPPGIERVHSWDEIVKKLSA